MLTGVYQWDRQPVMAYIQTFSAEPHDDGFDMRLRNAPGPIRAALIPEAHGEILKWWRARFTFDAGGSWRLLHFDFEVKDWIEWAVGEWRQEGPSIQLTMQRLHGAQAFDPSPLVLEAEGDRLLLGRPLAGTLFGLLGFRLVSPLSYETK